MALRDFYPLSESAAQPIADRPAFAEHSPELTAPTSGESQAESALPATQHLAMEMEQARRQLLELLLKNPQAIGMLTEQLSRSADEGVDYSLYNPDKLMDNRIVQDNRFVQPAIDSMFQPDELSRHDELASIHFFPALLIRVADRIQAISSADPGYKTKLSESCRRLQALRQQMIAGNTGLVAFVAYKYKTTCLSFEDLMQEGIIGLIRAVDRFDPGRGIRFSTYAIFWIKQAISRLIVKQEKVVRLPVALAEKASAVFEAMRSCYLENNRWPSLSELQAHCELAPEDIKTISSYYQATHSLDASLSDENDDQTLMTSLQQQFALP